MFDQLTQKLDKIFRNFSGKGTISEKNVQDAARDIRMALLEADVNYRIVKDVIEKVKEKAMGRDVLKSISPGQMFVKIVHDELVEIMGTGYEPLQIQQGKIFVLMLVGLQGSGKTTFCGKLGIYLRKRGRKPLLVAGDIYRPAAIDQLQTLGKSVDIPVFSLGNQVAPPEICRQAYQHAAQNSYDTVILDTAGRLHIDEALMEELQQIRKNVPVNEVLFVADAMTGQEAVNIARTFDEKVGMDGVCLTKMDGDARGGASLSIKYVTGKPVKFIGTGEKLSDLEEFHPDRIVSRILGMGDIVSLVEKAQEHFDMDQARELEKKLRKQDFDLDDFLKQLHQIRKMGPITKMLEMIPGFQQLQGQIDPSQTEKQFKQMEAIIYSMTVKERRKPEILNGERRLRIARGSGTGVDDVNRLIKSFMEMKKMMKIFKDPKQIAKLKNMMPFK